MGYRILIFGPQGSGKGTQAEMIEASFKIPHISTGAIFRDHIKEKTAIGLEIEHLIHAGHLAPNELTNEIVRERLVEDDCKNGFVLDGYPRNLNQAEYLDSITKIDFALEVWLADEESIKRISSRRSCEKCGRIYHLLSHPPKRDGLCDACGGNLMTRKDDALEAIKQRLSIYHEHTEPLIEYYTKKGIYRKVDGTGSIDEVAASIAGILK